MIPESRVRWIVLPATVQFASPVFEMSTPMPTLTSRQLRIVMFVEPPLEALPCTPAVPATEPASTVRPSNTSQFLAANQIPFEMLACPAPYDPNVTGAP